MSSFKYEPLFTDGDSIRLLRLLKDPRTDEYGFSDTSKRRISTTPIRCDIQVSYIGSRRVRYDAVSYCWMTHERTRTIYVGGEPFLVSPVVEDILTRLRDEKQDRLLWLDLICIDQSNEVEKSTQVQRMRDIFSEAETVIVSLGPHSVAGLSPPQNEHLLDEFRALNARRRPSVRTELVLSDDERPFERRVDLRTPTKEERLRNERRGYDSALKLITSTLGAVVPGSVPLPKNDADDLGALLRHPWFDRVWVLQEVAAARQLLIICGEKEVGGKFFARLHNRILSRVRDGGLRIRLDRLRPLLDYMSKSPGEIPPKPELLTLLHRFRTWKATEPHDKVYALLGLSKDGLIAPQLKPDYTLPVETVYRRVAQYMISRYDSLAVLTHANVPAKIEEPRQSWGSWLFGSPANTPRRPDMPSWCPDWRIEHPLGSPDPVSTSPNQRSSHPFSATIASQSDYDAGLLRVSGFTVASIHSARSIEVVVPKALQGIIKDVPATRDELSEDLKAVSALLVGATGQGLLKNDQICLLEGTTGIAILRPKGDAFQLISLRHSQFTQLCIDLYGCRIKTTAATFFGDSVYGTIARSLVSREMNIPARFTASWQIFDIV